MIEIKRLVLFYGQVSMAAIAGGVLMSVNFDQAVVELVIEQFGGVDKAQNLLGYSERMGVYNWRLRGLPLRRVAEIHMHTQISIDCLLEGVAGARKSS